VLARSLDTLTDPTRAHRDSRAGPRGSGLAAETHRPRAVLTAAQFGRFCPPTARRPGPHPRHADPGLWLSWNGKSPECRKSPRIQRVLADWLRCSLTSGFARYGRLTQQGSSGSASWTIHPRLLHLCPDVPPSCLPHPSQSPEPCDSRSGLGRIDAFSDKHELG